MITDMKTSFTDVVGREWTDKDSAEMAGRLSHEALAELSYVTRDVADALRRSAYGARQRLYAADMVALADALDRLILNISSVQGPPMIDGKADMAPTMAVLDELLNDCPVDALVTVDHVNEMSAWLAEQIVERGQAIVTVVPKR